MKIGMLYFSNDPKMTLIEKIQGAVDYYQKKYQRTADLVFVHPTMFVDGIQMEGVEIRTNRSVLPNHFWIGVKDEKGAQP